MSAVTIVVDSPIALIGKFQDRWFYFARGGWRYADGTPTGDCLDLALQRALRIHRGQEDV